MGLLIGKPRSSRQCFLCKGFEGGGGRVRREWLELAGVVFLGGVELWAFLP